MEKEMRICNFRLETGDLVICRPLSAPPPNLELMDNSQYGGFSSQIPKRILFAAKDHEKPSRHRLAAAEELPYISLNVYKTQPNYTQLCRMSTEELSCVKNFSVWNEFGKIEFN